MRKVTQKTVDAFFRGKAVKVGNSRVDVQGEYSYYYLHDNLIAVLNRDIDLLHVTLAGWPTVTTRDRLNAIVWQHTRAHVYQQNHEQILEGKHDIKITMHARDWYSLDCFGDVWLNASRTLDDTTNRVADLIKVERITPT